MYPTHTGPIGCIMLVVWHHKCKLGQIDLILIIHHIHIKNLNFPMCHTLTPFKKACPHAFRTFNLGQQCIGHKHVKGQLHIIKHRIYIQQYPTHRGRRVWSYRQHYPVCIKRPGKSITLILICRRLPLCIT